MAYYTVEKISLVKITHLFVSMRCQNGKF